MRYKAFTLVEILVVVSIISLLSVAASYSVPRILSQARDTKITKNFQDLANVAERINTDYESYDKFCVSTSTCSQDVQLLSDDIAKGKGTLVIQKPQENSQSYCAFSPMNSLTDEGQIQYYCIDNKGTKIRTTINPGFDDCTSASFKCPTQVLAAEDQKMELPLLADTAEILGVSTKKNPNFKEVTIDPLDVTVGDIQNMTVKIDDPDGVLWIRADIEHDHGFDTVMLTLTEGNIESGIWFGKWLVYDTHTETYHTQFTAMSKSGKQNSVTLNWTDPCSFALSGDVSLSTIAGGESGCSLLTTNSDGGVNGVEQGDLNVDGGKTLTIGAGATLVFNPGKSIKMSGGGSIAITKSGAGGQIKKSYIWLTDADSDGYSATSTQYVGDTAPVANARRRYLMTASSLDYNDSSTSTYPGTGCTVGISSTCASGGGLTCTRTTDGAYTVDKFTGTGSYQWITPTGVSSVQYLVVGGGGGGGGCGGGGGAGGYSAGTIAVSGVITVTVGAGGAQPDTAWRTGGNGGNSVFSSITSTGGGGGGGWDSGYQNGQNGGSGGGAMNGGTVGSGTAGQGHDGGLADWGNSGGGGGGANGDGGAGSSSQGGTGGAGLSSSITGTSVDYAGGGGGVGASACGAAGGGSASYGGGAGKATAGTVGDSGTNGTGGGGGGGGCTQSTCAKGGAGGSGVVIIRYLTPISSCTVNNSDGTCGVRSAGFYNAACEACDGNSTTTVSSVGGLSCTVITDGSYTVNKFTTASSTGISTWNVPGGVTSVRYLVAGGGGGGGGNTWTGGGGAGGYRAGTNLAVSGSVAITVGVGGAGGAANTDGVAGATSSMVTSATTVAASGGGYGPQNGGGVAGGNGGSGGGGSSGVSASNGGAGNTGGYSPVEGYNGGNAVSGATAERHGGGGGGSGGLGGNATVSTGGSGGLGTANDITGISLYYAGGGGGGGATAAGSGGNGVGGNGGPYTSDVGAAGSANTGSGGGGAGTAGGNGANGVVILRYLTP
jgi:prepilin-type N-terminal cleavage/methylation domain-containing protein